MPLNKAVSNFIKPNKKEKDCLKIFNLQLDKGAKLDVQDGNGTTALMWAVQKLVTTKILPDRGANVNIQIECEIRHCWHMAKEFQSKNNFRRYQSGFQT